ncbi:DJ-1/PfpI family protein [Bacillaceae bacterium Marseille-Q3522]|nr:DJ-1/PfpI family protein [Bacillaceae bacterium Marseille-Q3522]
MMWKVGIFLFDEVEVLDFAGPFEVFSVTTLPDGTKPFQVKTITESGELIHARNGLKVMPDYSFNDAPSFDILIIPGGLGAREYEIKNEAVINWIKEQRKTVPLLASVCTGALLLAKAGLLDHLRATTHWASLDRLAAEFPEVKVVRNVKFVDEETLISSAGISAGINMSFHIVQKLLGKQATLETAKRMEYDLTKD